MVRALARELKIACVNVYTVEVGAETTFGENTLFGLSNMVFMVCFCTHHYGEWTLSVYSSFAELNLLSFEEHIPILPIRMCEDNDYPPTPCRDFDEQNLRPAQNKLVCSTDLVYTDWSKRKWDAEKCAKETKEALVEIGDKCPSV